jgi:HdeA/HdeB family
MTNKLTAALLTTLCVAAYVVQPAAAAPGTPLAMQVAAASAPPSDAQVAPGRWDVTRALCTDLLNASDDDRASASMFYFGYLAAKYGIRVIDVNKLSDNIHKVMVQCGHTPTMPITQAFRLALGHPHK